MLSGCSVQGLWLFRSRIRTGLNAGIECAGVVTFILVAGMLSTAALVRQEAGSRKQHESAATRPHSHSAIWQTSPYKYALDRIGNRGIGAELNFYSMEQERAVGRTLAQQFESSHVVITDRDVNDYVAHIANAVVRHSDAKISLTVKVVDDGQVNAYDIPGGFIYVNSGLILAADDEASLACMLAHEIAHVAARHGVKYLVHSSRLETPKAWREFYRDMEREADLLAIEYVYAAGYDPTAFVRFFEKVRLHKLVFVTPDHPSLQERIRDAQIVLNSILPRKDAYLMTTNDFEVIKARLRILTSRSERKAISRSHEPRLKRDRHP